MVLTASNANGAEYDRLKKNLLMAEKNCFIELVGKNINL